MYLKLPRYWYILYMYTWVQLYLATYTVHILRQLPILRQLQLPAGIAWGTVYGHNCKTGGAPCVSGRKPIVKYYRVPFTLGFRICTKFSTCQRAGYGLDMGSTVPYRRFTAGSGSVKKSIKKWQFLTFWRLWPSAAWAPGEANNGRLAFWTETCRFWVCPEGLTTAWDLGHSPGC
eukprot:SAG11_NODE_7424_length_1146_cov_3.831901_1_plen_175_part_00